MPFMGLVCGYCSCDGESIPQCWKFLRTKIFADGPFTKYSLIFMVNGRWILHPLQFRFLRTINFAAWN